MGAISRGAEAADLDAVAEGAEAVTPAVTPPGDIDAVAEGGEAILALPQSPPPTDLLAAEHIDDFMAEEHGIAPVVLSDEFIQWFRSTRATMPLCVEDSSGPSDNVACPHCGAHNYDLYGDGEATPFDKFCPRCPEHGASEDSHESHINQAAWESSLAVEQERGVLAIAGGEGAGFGEQVCFGEPKSAADMQLVIAPAPAPAAPADFNTALQLLEDMDAMTAARAQQKQKEKWVANRGQARCRGWLEGDEAQV